MNINQTLFQAIRGSDPELAEDLNRRFPLFSSIIEVNHFFHQLLSSYPFDTAGVRSMLPQTDQVTNWFAGFRTHVLPWLMQHRCPTVTNRKTPAMYETVSGTA
jgi:hypothetical protein